MGVQSAKPLIFISHIHEEESLALLLAKELSTGFSNGIQFYVSSDSARTAGEDWYENVRLHIKQASLVFVLCSQASITRPWVNIELGAALAHEKKIIPLLHSSLVWDDLDLPLKTRTGCVLLDEGQLDKLVRFIECECDLTSNVNTSDLRNALIKEHANIHDRLSQQAITQRYSDANLKSELSEIANDFKRFSQLAKDTVCLHQGEYIQFQLFASELHKALRLVREPEALRELDRFLETNLAAAAHKSFEILKKHYCRRHEIQPRFCFKAAETRGKKKYIVPLFRDENVAYSSETPITENSAFDRIERTGRFYRIANIPQQVVDGSYVNARINIAKAEEYLERRTSDKVDGGIDTNWMECWVALDQDGKKIERLDPRSCYKSTLVIPLTLWHNSLRSEFLETISPKLGSPEEIATRQAKNGRLIFGYLCMDHVTREYFDDGQDMTLGYMVADLLSLYMITRIIYTESSDTYRQVELSS